MKIRNRSRMAGVRRDIALCEPQVVVVEEAGQLIAIVEDEVRGITRIPIGSVDPVVFFR
jgi:hypothetical protein